MFVIRTVFISMILLNSLGCHKRTIHLDKNCNNQVGDTTYCIIDLNSYPIGIKTGNHFRGSSIQVQFHTVYVIPNILLEDSIALRNQFAQVIKYFHTNLGRDSEFANKYLEAKRVNGFCKAHLWTEETTNYFLSMDTVFTMKVEVINKEGKFEYWFAPRDFGQN